METKEIRNPWVDAKVGVDAVTGLHVDSVATLVAHFKHRGWKPEILGVGPMITSPVFLRSWYMLPRAYDNSVIPQEGLQRLNYAKKLGLNIQGEIIAHEIVKREGNKIVQVDWLEAGIQLKKAASTAGEAISTAGEVLGSLIIGAVALPTVLLIDPVLILVVDNVRIEIFSWFERPGVS